MVRAKWMGSSHIVKTALILIYVFQKLLDNFERVVYFFGRIQLFIEFIVKIRYLKFCI